MKLPRKEALKKMKRYERILDDFVANGKKRSDENMWGYMKENRMSDHGIFDRRIRNLIGYP